MLKFKAYDEGNKKWHTNFQFIKSGNSENDWIIFASDQQPIGGDIDVFANPFFQQQVHIVQSIGIYDNNGVEIYEYDLVKKDDTLIIVPTVSELIEFEEAREKLYDLSQGIVVGSSVENIEDV